MNGKKKINFKLNVVSLSLRVFSSPSLRWLRAVRSGPPRALAALRELCSVIRVRYKTTKRRRHTFSLCSSLHCSTTLFYSILYPSDCLSASPLCLLWLPFLFFILFFFCSAATPIIVVIVLFSISSFFSLLLLCLTLTHTLFPFLPLSFSLLSFLPPLLSRLLSLSLSLSVAYLWMKRRSSGDRRRRSWFRRFHAGDRMVYAQRRLEGGPSSSLAFPFDDTFVILLR